MMSTVEYEAKARLVELVAKNIKSTLETAKAQYGDAWTRDGAEKDILSRVTGSDGVTDPRRANFASMMTPSEFAAWVAVEEALSAWPGLGPAQMIAWRKLALGDKAAKAEARAELRRIGIDPASGKRIAP